ncbi:MAG: hypothetical protein WKG07_47830 [Hymenobacter sp.]
MDDIGWGIAGALLGLGTVAALAATVPGGEAAAPLGPPGGQGVGAAAP